MKLFWAYVFLVWSLLTWILWALAMFTDTRLGRAFREGPSITKRRPDLVVFHPTWALLLVLVGVTTIVEENSGPEILTDTLTAVSLLVILVAVVVYWLPIRLPKWTDPYWHERRRAARRSHRPAKDASEAATEDDR